MTLSSIIKIFKLCLQGTGRSTLHKYLVNILANVHSKLAIKEFEVKEWLLSDQTFEKLGEMWLKMLGLYNEQTNWLSQVKLYSGTKGLLDMHKFTKLLKLFSATSWLHQTGRYPRKFEYWLWIHKNQSINSLYSYSGRLRPGSPN